MDTYNFSKIAFYIDEIIIIDVSRNQRSLEKFCNVIISDVVKIERASLGLKRILGLPVRMIKCGLLLYRLNKKYDRHIVYSNTMAVFGAFFYGLLGGKTIGHVHEIILKPKFLSKLMCFNYSCFNRYLIFNSNASYQWFVNNGGINKRGEVVHNGVEAQTYMYEEFKEDKVLKVALVGRINKWKGHSLLIDAISRLDNKLNFSVHFYGDVYGQQSYFIDELKAKLSCYQLSSRFTFHGFISNHDFWKNIDLLVVPSTEPEPFGMVAIEAMARAIPVIGSNHGGLAEILANGNGLLFEPNNVLSLSEKLNDAITSSTLRAELARRGYEAALNDFSVDVYGRKILNVIQEMINDGKK